MKVVKNYIDGEWIEGSSKIKKLVINPATEETLAVIIDSTREDTQQAIDAAKRNFYEIRTWRDKCPQERADLMLRLAEEIDQHKKQLAECESRNNGKPLREAECDIDDAVHCFRYYAGLINKPCGSVYQVNQGFGKMHSYTIHEPIGVCAQITPWNYPFLMAVWKIAPALAAGNSIVFKPSSNTPLSTIALFELLHSVGVPHGTANLVIGSGGVVGKQLAESHDVDMISFTGSTPVGQSIAAGAVGSLKRVGLELGGKSPNVIFADADIERAVEWAMVGIFFNQGEVCSAGSRIIIEQSIKDQFVTRLAERANALTLGNPLNNPDMGPLVSKAHMETVLRYIALGKAEGAKCVCGGERYLTGECASGYFIRPTVFAECTADMCIVKEEIFGPVVTVQTFTTEAEAIAMANDTPYGLAGAVFTTDGARALRVIGEIRAGITWVNCYNPTFNEAPWGGYKMSGLGRELGVHGFSEYQEIKQVNINLSVEPLGWYTDRS